MSINRTQPKTPGLALSVLSLLLESPMHPYEMKMRIKERGHEQVIQVRGGSLYDTVERLHRQGLIQPGETEREGRRPERTVYTITDAGRDELRAWLRQLLAEPAHEYPKFAAALAFMLTLDREEVVRLLRTRMSLMEGQIAGDDALLGSFVKQGLPRVVLIEGEYTQAIRRAEVDWIRSLIGEIEGEGFWPTREQLLKLSEFESTRRESIDKEGGSKDHDTR
jgi:DNA-binding PadR family transcriptional regulator